MTSDDVSESRDAESWLLWAAFLGLLVAWGLSVVLAYFVGGKHTARRIQQELKRKQERARKRMGRGGMGPGDDDPRRGGGT